MRKRFPTIVRLLLALALLASLVAITAAPASAAISAVSNTPTPNIAYTAATQTVVFTTGATFIGATITFPATTVVPATIAITNVTMTGATDGALTVASVTPNTTARTVAITLTAATATPAQAITAVIGSTTPVIVNPQAGSYTTLTAGTDTEAAFACTAYLIVGVAINAQTTLAAVVVGQTITVTNDIDGDNNPDTIVATDPFDLLGLIPGATVTIKFDRTAVGFATAATMTTTPLTVPVTLATATTLGGCFYASFKVPPSPTSLLGTSVTYNVWVTDGIVVIPAAARVTVIMPTIALLKGAALVAAPGATTTQAAGTTLSVAASGFEGGVGVSVYREAVAGTQNPAADTVIAAGTTDANGSFAAPLPTFTASTTTRGQMYGRDASAANNANPVALDVTLALLPGVSVNPPSGEANLLVTATAMNFTASSAPWAPTAWVGAGGITVGGVAVAAGGVTSCTLLSPNTDFQIQFRIPTGAASGTNIVQVTDAAGVSGSGNFVVGAVVLQITPDEGVPGMTVNVGGSKFIPAALITAPPGDVDTFDILYQGVDWGPTAAQGTQTVSGVGTWAVSLVIPDASTGYSVTPGDITIRATDNAGAVGVGTFTLLPRSLVLGDDTAVATQTVTYSIRGFRSNGTVTLTINTAPATTLGMVMLDALGSKDASFTMPIAIPAGPYIVTATGGVAGSMLSATDSLTVLPPTVECDPTGGPSGGPLKIKLSGYPGLSGVTAATMGTIGLVVPVGTQTGRTGTVDFLVNAPLLNLGVAIVTVTAGGVTATTTFEITSAPTTVATALASIYDQLEIVWYYTGTGLGWRLNDPGDPVGSADPELGLAGLTVNEAYWIQVTGPCTLIFEDGSTKALTVTDTNNGWWNIAWH